jgi:Putative Flp pilus-assembly TadE/G-like
MLRISFRSLLSDVSGGVALIFGLILPMILGLVGLAVDGGYWMMERSKLQAATDSAALSAAQTVQLAGSDPAVAAEGRRMLEKAYGAGLSGIRYQIQHPPLSGPLAGNTTAVEVLTERDQPTFFLSLFGIANTFVATRSVARVDMLAEACMLALSPDLDKAIEITGSSTVNIDCGIASNSDASNSVYLSGASDTTTTAISAVGDVFQSNNAKLVTTTGTVKSNSAAIADPYGAAGRNLKIPKLPAQCEASQLKIKKNTTLSPGRYCGGIDMTGGTTTFAPGIYYIDGGNLKANGNATLVGQDVTFVLTGTGGNIGLLEINGGANVSLHAPKSGTSLDGMLFFQDPGDASGNANPKNCKGYGGENIINGNANMDLSGVMYFPTQYLTISGGTSSNMTCLQLVAQKVKISGNSAIKGKCDANSGAEKIQRSVVELAE